MGALSKRDILYFQAPFYPLEAEKKGCMPSEYGLVFGIFELTVFLVSPIIGANLNRMGMKMTLNVGIGTVGVSSILFGTKNFFMIYYRIGLKYEKITLILV